MTVRTAEIVFAVLLALCSIGLIVKSAELKIGWVEDKGPGSGFWPFWLSIGMLLACLVTIYRWFTRQTAESVSTEPYITGTTLVVVGTSAVSILCLLLMTQWLGIYVALYVFLFVYVRFIGRHTWAVTLSIAICLPVFIFGLFEWALKIPLPKAVTDPLFYPTYDLIYAQGMGEVANAMKAPINYVPIAGVLLVAVYWIYKFIEGRRQVDS